MKKLLLIVWIFTNSKSMAQVHIETIDFSKLLPKYEYPVKYKSNVSIRIVNINRNVYKIEDGISSEDFNVTLPESMKSIKLPGFIFSLPSEVGMTDPKKAPRPLSEDELATKKINELLLAINYFATRLNESILYYNNIKHMAKDCSIDADKVLTFIKESTLTYLYNSLVDPFPDLSLSLRLKDTLFIQRRNAELILSQIRKSIDSYSESVIKNRIEELVRIEQAVKEYIDKLKTQSLTPAEIDKITQEIDIRKAKIDKLRAQMSEPVKGITEMEENYKRAQATVDGMLEVEKDDKLLPIVNAFKIFTNIKNYEYSSAIIKPEKDETKLTIIFTPESLNACMGPDKITTEITLKARGGLKVDVSSGAFINGGNEDFLGSTFYYEKLPNDQRKIVTAKRNNNHMLSVGGLMHLHRRSPSCFKMGGSIGVSTTANFDDLNFHIGPSLFFGNKDRVIITGGLTLKTSKVLDRQLEVENIYDKENSPDEIPLVNVFPKGGWFVGVSYNFSKLK